MRKRYRNAALRNFSPPKPRRLEPISHSSHDDPCFPRQTPQIGGSWNALEGESENIGTTHPREIPGPNAPWRSYSSPAAITKNTSPGHSRRIGRSDVSTASVAENVWKGSLTEFYREILMEIFREEAATQIQQRQLEDVYDCLLQEIICEQMSLEWRNHIARRAASSIMCEVIQCELRDIALEETGGGLINKSRKPKSSTLDEIMEQIFDIMLMQRLVKMAVDSEAGQDWEVEELNADIVRHDKNTQQQET